MSGPLDHPMMFLQRIPAIEEVHVLDINVESVDNGDVLTVPITVWFDDFEHPRSTETEGSDSTTDDAKISQLESITNAYVRNFSAEIQAASDEREWTHVVVFESSRTRNPLRKLWRRGVEIRWQWRVWRAKTPREVTPLPLDYDAVYADDTS